MRSRGGNLRTRWGGLCTALGVAAALSGCGRGADADGALVLTGVVEGARPETGLLLVRVSESQTHRLKDARLACLVPSDAEVYVNDKFSHLEVIEIGDKVELLGYFDERNPRDAQFVVSLANISRNEPPPPALDLSIPATQPTNPTPES